MKPKRYRPLVRLGLTLKSDISEDDNTMNSFNFRQRTKNENGSQSNEFDEPLTPPCTPSDVKDTGKVDTTELSSQLFGRLYSYQDNLSHGHFQPRPPYFRDIDVAKKLGGSPRNKAGGQGQRRSRFRSQEQYIHQASSSCEVKGKKPNNLQSIRSESNSQKSGDETPKGDDDAAEPQILDIFEEQVIEIHTDQAGGEAADDQLAVFAKQQRTESLDQFSMDLPQHGKPRAFYNKTVSPGAVMHAPQTQPVGQHGHAVSEQQVALYNGASHALAPNTWRLLPPNQLTKQERQR